DLRAGRNTPDRLGAAHAETFAPAGRGLKRFARAAALWRAGAWNTDLRGSALEALTSPPAERSEGKGVQGPLLVRFRRMSVTGFRGVGDKPCNPWIPVPFTHGLRKAR